MPSYDQAHLRSLLPHPHEQAHKYSRGKLVVVAGSASYPGAACLAAHAAQRLGAGYVEVFTHPKNVVKVQAYRPSLVVRSWEELLSRSELEQSIAGRPCAYLVGSGFDPKESESGLLLMRVLKQAKAPVLVDGGAIGALSSTAGRTACRERARRGEQTLVTPHGGEAAAMGRSMDIAGLPQVDYAIELALEYSSTIVLKSSTTIISNGELNFAMSEGTAALAKAGTGDVLAGMIGALLAQGLDPLDAAVLGATLHARAGRLAADELTDICVVPEDLLAYIGAAIKLTENLGGNHFGQGV